MIKNHLVLISVLASFLLSACSGGEVRRNLGLDRNSPDEFLVVSKPPLSVPPDFSLEPPTDFAKAQSKRAGEEAKSVLFPEVSKKNEGSVTRGENSLLQQAGTNDANPEIRDILSKEAARQQIREEEKGILDSITDTFSPDDRDPILDVDKEEERIAENLKEGKSASEGEVEEKEEGSKGIINNILGL